MTGSKLHAGLVYDLYSVEYERQRYLFLENYLVIWG